MKYGFSFNGTHTAKFDGLTVRTASRPIKPETRNTVFTAPFSDGAVSAAAKNPYGREFYESRVFTVTMFLTAGDFKTLNKRLAKISSWLTGAGELIFDDTPLIIWDAKAYGEIDYMPERSGTKAVLSASFTVEPYGRLAWRVCDGPVIGQAGIYLGDSIPIGAFDRNYTKVISAGGLSEELFTVLNYGDRHVRPIITIKTLNDKSPAYVGTVTFTMSNGSSMMVSTGTEIRELVIDCKNHTLTDRDGNNIMGRSAVDQAWFSGSFLELLPGRNVLSIRRTASDSAGGIEITVDFAPAYMWDADFGEPIGGEAYAGAL